MKKVFCVVVVFVCVFLAVLPAYGAVDWSDYPQSNVIPLPFNFANVGETLNRNGLTIEVLEDGSIHIQGTSTGSTVLVLADITNLTVGDIYYWNYYFASEAPPTPAFYVDVGEITATWNSISRNSIFVAKQARYQVYCEVNSGYSVDFTVNVIMAKSPTPVEYQPYVPYFIQKADMEANNWNAFKYATYTLTIQTQNPTEGDQTIVRTFEPNLFTGGTTFLNAWNIIADGAYLDELYSATIVIDFDSDSKINYLDNPIAYTADKSMYGVGTFFLSTDTVRYSATALDAGSQFQLTIDGSILEYPVLISKIEYTVSASNVHILQTSALYTNAYAYNAGYAAGFNDGAYSGNEEIYRTGKEEGYRNGFIEGKAEGLQFSQTGDWRNLISAVLEAPVNTFQSLFSFEVLGMDMRAAIGAILALCVLLIIIKKVVL